MIFIANNYCILCIFLCYLHHWSTHCYNVCLWGLPSVKSCFFFFADLLNIYLFLFQKQILLSHLAMHLSFISSVILHEDVVIGRDTRIGADTQISQSVIGNNCVIGQSGHTVT